MSEVNKMTGYAIGHLRTDEHGRLVDARVNARSPLLTGTARLGDFQAHLSGVEALTHADPSLAEDEPCRAVVHDPIRGIAGVLMVRPVWLPSWHRLGDDLDRAGELRAPGARLEFLPTALWPYSGQLMDSATGADLVGCPDALLRALEDPEVECADDLERAARAAGFESLADARVRVVPSVPRAVRELVEWGELFTDPAVVNELRPALYTWWS